VRDAYAAIKHDGYVIALEGEAGIGKTRLAEALLAHAQARGATVIHMRCYAGETNLSYGPFVEGLRMVVGQISTCISNAPLAAISEAARLLPDLVRRHPKLPPAPPLDTPGAQLRFFEGVTDVLLAVASDTAPLVLCFDDLHWADAATLDLLTYLARRLGGRLVCLVLTWRQEDVGPTHRLRDLLAELERVHRATTITLQRLDQAAVAVLVEAAAPGEHARDVALRLYQETEGLPLFVIEYLSSLQQSPPTMNNWPLPSGVRNLLHARLRAVDEQLRPVLATAAVIGRSFDFDTLRTASGHNEDDVVTALETLLAHGVIAEVNQPGSSTVTYDFRHDKLRALVYDETSAARRRLIHRRVAEALIAQTQGAAAFAGQIAQHFRLAGQVQQAALYFKLAGDHTRAVYANVDAKTYYETALALGHTDHVVLHEALGDLHTLGGEYSVAICSYEAALSSCSGAACATLQHKLGTVYQRRGAWMQAEHHFEQALRMLDTATAAGEQARILVDRSLIAHQQGRSADAARFAEQALELAASATDARALAQAHNVLGVLRSSAGDYVAAQHHLEHSLGLAGHLADPTLRAAASNNLALVCSAAGDTVRALDLFEAALQLCTALGDRHREAALHNNMADLLHAAGRSDEAITHLKQAVVIYAEIGVEAGAVQPEIWKLVEW
jgi:predicted ATPase